MNDNGIRKYVMSTFITFLFVSSGYFNSYRVIQFLKPNY